MDSQSRGPGLKTVGWLQGQSSYSSFWGWLNKQPEVPDTKDWKVKAEPHPQKEVVKFFFKVKVLNWKWLIDPVIYGSKIISMTHQQGRLRDVLATFMHKFGWWDFVYFIAKP